MTPAAALLSLILQAAPAADAVDPALRAAVERFFELQEKEDVAGYLALWSPSGTPPRAEQLKYVFDNGDDKYSDLVISRVSINGDRARVRINVRRERIVDPRRPDGTPFVSAYPMSIALAYEKAGGDWKLLSEGPAADDLAASLLEAPDDAAREALLASEPTLAGQQVISSLGRSAGAAAVRQNYNEARRIYELVVQVARRGGFKKEEGEALQNIANAFYFQRRFPEALAAYEQRLALERERQDDAGIAAALAGVATIRYSYAEYGEALKGYEEALALHQKTDDVAGIAFVSLSIGNIGYLQGDFPAAIAAYQRSLDLNRTMFNVDGESRALEGLGRVFMAQGDYAGRARRLRQRPHRQAHGHRTRTARAGCAKHRRRALPARQPRRCAGQLRREPRPLRGGWRPAERGPGPAGDGHHRARRGAVRSRRGPLQAQRHHLHVGRRRRVRRAGGRRPRLRTVGAGPVLRRGGVLPQGDRSVHGTRASRGGGALRDRPVAGARRRRRLRRRGRGGGSRAPRGDGSRERRHHVARVDRGGARSAEARRR